MTRPAGDQSTESDPLLSNRNSHSTTSYSTAKPPTRPDEETPPTAPLSRTPESYTTPETSPLGRTLTWPSAYIIVISRVIGSGIFATPGTILRTVGSPGLSLLLWALGALVTACGLAVSIEYGCMLPRSGGYKVYLEFTYRYPRFLAGTVVATHVVMLGFSASNCVVFSRYVLFALGMDAEASDFLRKGVGIGLLTVITIIHGVFPRAGIRMQNWLGYVKVGIIAFMILSGLYVVAFQKRSEVNAGQHLPSWDNIWEGTIWNWSTIAVAFFQVTYSYAGLDNVSYLLNEVKDPVRTLPSVTSAALVTAGVLYTLVNIAYFIVVPIPEIKESGEMISALFFERLFGENLGRVVLPLVIALSAVGNVMVVVLAQVSALCRRCRYSSALTWPQVSDEAGNRPPRSPPIRGYPRLYVPVWIAARRSTTPLPTLSPGYRPPPVEGGIFFHSFGRGISRPVHGPGRWYWPPLAAVPEARPTQALQSVDTRRGGRIVSECVAARRAVICPWGVANVCNRRNKHVRFVPAESYV